MASSYPALGSDATRYKAKVARLSREKGIPTGTAHDERFGEVRTYHQDVLKQTIT